MHFSELVHRQGDQEVRLGSACNDLRDEIAILQWELLQRNTAWVGVVALTLLTLWILVQGYRIVTGQSREAAMGLVVTALRASLIIGLATSMAEGSSNRKVPTMRSTRIWA